MNVTAASKCTTMERLDGEKVCIGPRLRYHYFATLHNIQKYTGFFFIIPQKISTHHKSNLKPGCDTTKVYIVQILLLSPNLASE